MQLPIASNYNILIADKRGKMVVVECTPNIKKIGEAKSVDDGYLVCTRRYYASFTYHRIIGTKALVL